MASRAERVENELVALLDWIERYFAVRDLLPPPAIAAGVASARAALALPADAPSQPAPEGAGEAGDSDDGGNCRAHGAPVCEPCAFDRGYAAGLCKNAEAQPSPTPRAEAVREACAAVDPRLNLKHPDKSYVEGGVDAVAAMRAAIRSLPLPAAPASAEAVAREAAEYVDAEWRKQRADGWVPIRLELLRRAVAHALRAKVAK